MAPRIPLQELNPNRVPNGELSVEQRSRILGIRDAKAPIHEIVKKYKISRGAVENTIRQESLRQEATTLPRSGRPSIVTPTFERRLLRLVRKFRSLPTRRFSPPSVPLSPKLLCIGYSKKMALPTG